jgi:hypothetical protein
MDFFGDSYDIVKQSLIRWLGSLGEWSVHPMLTHAATDQQVKAFESFLGARIICREILGMDTDRDSYLACALELGNLFLDPDTGLRLKMTSSKANRYLFAAEFRRIVDARPSAITLVFDQCLPRGSERASMEHKLEELQAAGVHCFAYMSHACFIVGGQDKSLVQRALRRVMSESRLPEARFLAPWNSTSGNDC